MSGVLYAGAECLDPRRTAQQCVEKRLPIGWVEGMKPNGYRCPSGWDSGSGAVLLLRSDFDRLELHKPHNLEIDGKVLKSLYVLNARCVTAGAEDEDDNAVMLVELVDRRRLFYYANNRLPHDYNVTVARPTSTGGTRTCTKSSTLDTSSATVTTTTTVVTVDQSTSGLFYGVIDLFGSGAVVPVLDPPFPGAPAVGYYTLTNTTTTTTTITTTTPPGSTVTTVATSSTFEYQFFWFATGDDQHTTDVSQGFDGDGNLTNQVVADHTTVITYTTDPATCITTVHEVDTDTTTTTFADSHQETETCVRVADSFAGPPYASTYINGVFYVTSTMEADCKLWSWDSMFRDMWTDVGSFYLGDYPGLGFTPPDFPVDVKVGSTTALWTMSLMLARFDATLALDLFTDRFSIVEPGRPDPLEAAAENRLTGTTKLWDGLPTEAAWTHVPESIYVYFPYATLVDGSTDRSVIVPYSQTFTDPLALPAKNGVIAGTQIAIQDQLVGNFRADGKLLNLDAQKARAKEWQDYFFGLAHRGIQKMHLSASGIQDAKALRLGGQIQAVGYGDRGGGSQTELYRSPALNGTAVPWFSIADDGFSGLNYWGYGLQGGWNGGWGFGGFSSYGWRGYSVFSWTGAFSWLTNLNASPFLPS